MKSFITCSIQDVKTVPTAASIWEARRNTPFSSWETQEQQDHIRKWLDVFWFVLVLLPAVGVVATWFGWHLMGRPFAQAMPFQMAEVVFLTVGLGVFLTVSHFVRQRVKYWSGLLDMPQDQCTHIVNHMDETIRAYCDRVAAEGRKLIQVESDAMEDHIQIVIREHRVARYRAERQAAQEQNEQACRTLYRVNTAD